MIKYILTILFFLVNCIPSGVSAQWVKINSLSATSVREIKYESGAFYAPAGNGLWRSTNDGVNWTNISNGLSGDALITYDIFFDSGSIFITTVEGNFKTTNGGLNWEAKSTGIVIGPGATKRYCYSLIRYHGALYCGAFSGLYKSTDGGDNWTLSGIPGPHSNVEVLYEYDDQLWAGRTNTASNGTLQRTTDDGATWNTIQFFGQFNPEVFCFHTAPDNKLFIGTGHGVYATSNGGANWAPLVNGLPSDPYNSSIIQRGSTLYTSTKFGGNGVYQSTNEGQTWEEISGNLPFVSDTYDLIIVGDTLYLAASNGIYKSTISSLTAVHNSTSELPGNFSLYQNYPNPFNPSTKIKFDIPKSGFVTLTVYDATGRQVAQLVNENLSPGSYSAEFRADGLTSGIYFYKLITGEYSTTRKMVLVK
ncbi:MAG: T9SS type A sorting domain-containing protein [Ignavibacteriae bacterium]|nr:T9SS type A sorting domain-containing protein [Ignavibacteriota bacterium]MCB9244592.1 T9SS type A sorting domain-containing protein [Ignavibacteriales bacterium]